MVATSVSPTPRRYAATTEPLRVSNSALQTAVGVRRVATLCDQNRCLLVWNLMERREKVKQTFRSRPVLQITAVRNLVQLPPRVHVQVDQRGCSVVKRGKV